jgi:hypothetical protein
MHQLQIAANLDALANDLERQAARDLDARGAGARRSPPGSQPAEQATGVLSQGGKP